MTKIIRDPLPTLVAVSFHVGEDKNNRQKLRFQHMEWEWMLDDEGRVLLVYTHEEPMHVMGSENEKGSGAVLEVSEDESVVYDPLDGTIEAVGNEKMEESYREI